MNRPIKNINKTVKVKKLKNKLKRLPRQVSRKYEANKSGNSFIKTNNIIKLEKEIKLLHRKLSTIRNNHIHQATIKVPKNSNIKYITFKGISYNIKEYNDDSYKINLQ